jgi:hypothetical protein
MEDVLNGSLLKWIGGNQSWRAVTVPFSLRMRNIMSMRTGPRIVVMRLAVVIALAAGGASSHHEDVRPVTADDVLAHLDLHSFAGPRVGFSGKPATFADLGFVVTYKDFDSAVLFRKSDGFTKSFEILRTRQHGVRLCAHDKWTVMPNSPQPFHFDYTTALIVVAPKGRWWKAEHNPGGFVGCINNPSPQTDRTPATPQKGIGGLLEAAFPLHRSPQN